MPTNTYVALDTTTVTGSPVSSVTLSSISQAYTDLVLIINGTTANDSNGGLRFNGDTTSNYSWTRMQGNGSSATSARGVNDTSIQAYMTGTSTGGLGNAVIQILNYTSTTTFKSVLSRHQATSTATRAIVGVWRKTPEAINSITVVTDNSSWNVGTTFSLYGIRAPQVYTPSTIPSTLNVGDSIFIPYTGSATTLSIPSGVNTCQLEVIGAQGGNAYLSNGGGKGGYASGTYTLGGSATTVYAYVGGRGTSRTASTGSGTLSGGFNGGGNGFYPSNSNQDGYASSGGGGGTDFRIGGTALSNRIVIAGGGGGEGGGSGGNGGYLTGTNANPPNAGEPFQAQGGFGGTQSAGGAGGGASSAGNSSTGNAGSLGIGGDGGNNRTFGQGGGGGGGYYGGGGGGTCGNGSGSGGGGGSSFVGSLANPVTSNGVNTGNGYAIFTKLS
jgi:hypothetical protein